MVSVREAVESADYDDFLSVLRPDVVWVGLRPRELCRNRQQVAIMFDQAREHGVEPTPEIVAEHDDLLVVDAHLPRDGRHHVVVLEDGLVSEVRVYPDRQAALAAVEEL